MMRHFKKNLETLTIFGNEFAALSIEQIAAAEKLQGKVEQFQK